MTSLPYEKYRGKRALLLTRVSTSRQVDMYGHAWQERQTRKLIIEPFDLLLDEERHIIRDTYSGLEFRQRAALDQILEMAARHEFDVLCMEVLDRGLGRKGLPREMFRMQLRELGIRVLTTDPNEHSDDDSLVGEMIRLIKGYKAEEEINDLVRRTMGGKWEKTKQGKIIGAGSRPYGFKVVYDERGKPCTLTLHLEVFLDVHGEEWTEVKVVEFIFELSKAGVSTRSIAEILNEKQIPPPNLAKGIKKKTLGVWQPSSVTRVLKQSACWGEYRQFKTLAGEKRPGKKHKSRVQVPDDQQIIIVVPAIVSKELAEEVHRLLPLRQKKAKRNNKGEQIGLLRGGYIKCGHCGANLTTRRSLHNSTDYIRYYCVSRNVIGRCKGCSVSASSVEAAAWEKAVEIIRDPTELETNMRALASQTNAAEEQKKLVARLNSIRAKQKKLRKNLSELIQAGKLDKGTEEFLSTELHMLAQQEETASKELASEQAVQDKYNKLHERIAAFHQRCLEWGGKLDDCEFIPDYDFKRDAVEFFGITVTAYRAGSDPRFTVEAKPPSIVSLIS